MYENKLKIENFDFQDLDKELEGKYRNNHFRGVGTIVSKLFNLFKPTKAFFGEKDFQQTRIIDRLIKIKNFQTELVICPTVREQNGLALSSRNALLSTENKEKAAVIYKTLIYCKENFEKKSFKNIYNDCKKEINSLNDFELEYLEITDNKTLKKTKKNVIFCQSSVTGHSELAWIFNCVARIGWLNRMTQFKEKAGSNKEKASVGLYSYPTLMAADILLYKATHVPVGEDQKQHLELCRDIAVKFNNDFNCKDFFTLPEPIITKEVARIMSLKDGTKKMSKSDESEASRINLTDTEEEIVQKIKKAKTDNELIPDTESKLADRPEARNLINIFSILSGITIEKTLKELSGKNFSELKNRLSEVLIKEIVPIGKKIKEFKKDTDAIKRILKSGSEKANIESQKTIKEVHKIVGLSLS